jgi:hypothetical protein
MDPSIPNLKVLTTVAGRRLNISNQGPPALMQLPQQYLFEGLQAYNEELKELRLEHC